MTDSKVLIMIAAYNEAQNIENVIDNLTLNYPQYDYIIINDGSRDDTEKICKKRNYNYLNLPMNLGIGGAIQMGYMYARKNNYDIAVQLDGDGQHDPKYIESVIKPIEEGRAEYVIGSRFINKEGFQSSRLRRTGIIFLSGLICLLCGCRVLDVTSGFRAVGSKTIDRFAYNYPQDYPEPEAVIDAVMNGESVIEVPVIMRERINGKSSINMKKSIYYMIKVTLDIIVCRISYGVRR